MLCCKDAHSTLGCGKFCRVGRGDRAPPDARTDAVPRVLFSESSELHDKAEPLVFSNKTLLKRWRGWVASEAHGFCLRGAIARAVHRLQLHTQLARDTAPVRSEAALIGCA